MPYNPPRVKVTKLTGKALEESMASWEKSKKDVEFYETHRKEFLEKYPDQWIGIDNAKLMGVADSFDELLEMFRAKGIPTNHMLVRRMSTKPRILVVPTI